MSNIKEIRQGFIYKSNFFLYIVSGLKDGMWVDKDFLPNEVNEDGNSISLSVLQISFESLIKIYILLEKEYISLTYYTL